MLKLRQRAKGRWNGEPMVVRVTTDLHRPAPLRANEAILLDQQSSAVPVGFKLYLWKHGLPEILPPLDAPHVPVPTSMDYLDDGDIVRFSPVSGELWTMYRRASTFNTIFVTEACNSNCVMCSQPPRDIDDNYLTDAYLEAIPLMSRETPELGITGGEPTLLGDRLLTLIGTCKNWLPSTALHMLSNGRMFRYQSLSKAVARIGHPDFMIGIPLYSDLPDQHEFVVQAKGAYDQTVRGILNLKRYNQKIELRVVLHRLTIDRLPQLARFIGRNLPFVDQVALMGLEMMGYVKMNLDALWVDPIDYQPALAEAVHTLASNRINVSIYNHQLCVLDRTLWPYARQSISDWKNEYFETCSDCAVRNQCGGFFSSAALRYSDHIHPIEKELV